MKSLKIRLKDIATINNLYYAYLRAKKGKENRKEVIRFKGNLMYILAKLIHDILNGTYKPGKYRVFSITDPKPRTIMALPFIDRVLHQFIVTFIIIPFFVKRFDPNSCACITGRGSHYAMWLTQHYIRYMVHKYGDSVYIVKLDIKGFFYNIDQIKLYLIFERLVKDRAILALLRTIIFDKNVAEKGVPIGNYTSQFFANIVLDELDRYLRSLGLRIKIVRYMDDIIIIASCYEEALEAAVRAEKYLNYHMALDLNPKSDLMPYTEGVMFVGYHIYYDHIALSKRSVHSAYSMIRKYRRTGNKEAFVKSAISWFGHAQYADSYGFIKHNFGPYRDLFPENMQHLMFDRGYKETGMLKARFNKNAAQTKNYDKYMTEYWTKLYDKMRDQSGQ